MNKQIFIVALTALAIPAVVFAPSFAGGTPSGKKSQPSNTGGQPGASSKPFTPQAAVSQYASELPDVLAGAIAAAGVAPSGATSGAAYEAGFSAVSGQSVPATPASGTQSKKLGRLGN